VPDVLKLAEAPGFRLLPGHFDPAAQRALLAEVVAAIGRAPLYHATMPKSGRPMTVAMTNCGPLGWVSDRGGYRYQATHPLTAQPWPPIPVSLLALWREATGYAADPEACLVNHYGPEAKLGLHRDADEADQSAPVLSVSLGDSALFRIGGPQRSDPTQSLRLASGDVVVLGGAARQCFHGVDRIYPGTSRLLAGTPLEGGRLNLTLRRVTLAQGVTGAA
jgi:alkylated DNA repair protein (DNA oxidative demethylase)